MKDLGNPDNKDISPEVGHCLIDVSLAVQVLDKMRRGFQFRYVAFRSSNNLGIVKLDHVDHVGRITSIQFAPSWITFQKCILCEALQFDWGKFRLPHILSFSLAR